MRALLRGCAGLLLVGCSLPTAGRTVHIDYLQVVRLAGITYLAQSPPGGRPLTQADLGPVAGTVKVRLADRNDPSHKLQDGDAAYLPVGARLYQVNGYRQQFRLAAAQGGGWLLFEAFENASANKGSDLLDIQGKVAAIEVDDPAQQGQAVGLIDSADEVGRLVTLLDAAPVGATRPPSGVPEYDLVFVLEDGTVTRRTFDLQSGWLAGGIEAPASFGAGIAAAVAKPPSQPIPPAFAVPERGYAYTLYTHCGLDWRTRFDATYWDLLSWSGSGIGDPYQDGTMTLTDANTARFDFGASGAAKQVLFTRHPVGQPLKAPTGCD